MIQLDETARESWRTHHYVVLRGALDTDERRQLRAFADELAAWPETPGKWMKYFEPGPARLLCRVEAFLPYHDGMRTLLLRPDLMACLAELFGEPAVLFKEKINFKLPGGAGFAAHQDAPAFTSFGQTWHVTAMLSIDAATPENGCLEIVDGFARQETLDQADDGTLAPAVVDRLVWRPLATDPGDVVLFDSYVPHRSGPNRTAAPRRAVYVTYNPASQGDHGAAYYARKRRVFPPECERDPETPLDPEAALFNLGNPIR